MTEATKVAPTKATKTKKAIKHSKPTKANIPVKTNKAVKDAIKANIPVKTKNTKVETSTDSPWYVFCSTGCGYCKKSEPIVEELNNEGYDILTLDLSEPDNAKLAQELKTEYGVQCGTPWFINAETGKGVCGFRDKDILKKWLDGEDIPAPPKPTGPPPRPPFLEAPDEEVETWKKEYSEWLKKNEHLPENQRKTVDAILAMPRPKTQPPTPPIPTATDEDLEKWGKLYDKWKEINDHLPNLQPADVIVQRFKAQRDQAGGAPGAPGVVGNPMAGGPLVKGAPYNKDLNTEFYYIVESGKRVKVIADEGYLRVLEHQYYVHEHDNNKLTKVVGDDNFND